jgi:hypothetical protein
VAEGLQKHVISKDVISQPVFLPADSPLAFARFVSGVGLGEESPIILAPHLQPQDAHE